MMMQALTRNCLALVCRALPQRYAGLMAPITKSFHSLRPLDESNRFPSMLLQPSIPSLIPSCGMKQKGRLKLRCDGCYYVMRQGRMYVMCKSKPRHKQMMIKKSDKKTWILSHATQGPHGIFPRHREW